jgi:hypothetical protein
MQQQRRHSRITLGLVALGLLAGAAFTASPAQAVDAVGPYYAEPSWDRKIAPVNRFVVLTGMSSAAVLDKETGLVWERRHEPINLNFFWDAARQHCMDSKTGNHKGWRLPSVHELASLVDPAHTGPALPAGHPFDIALPINTNYWTATTNAADATQAWAMSLVDGSVIDLGPKVGGQARAWCVRGGMNADVY